MLAVQTSAARKVRTAKSRGQGKRGKLSGAASVVRPLVAKRRTEYLSRQRHANPEPSNDPHHHSL